MDLQEQDRFHIHQKLTLMIKKYRVFLDDGRGKPGDLVAFVEQDKDSLKDKVTIYTDERKSEVLAEFAARKLIDMTAAFDVHTPDGDRIGSFQKEFRTSLYRSTWTLEQEGEPPITAVERSKVLAILRRAWPWLPGLGDYPFPVRHHFVFKRGETVVGGVDKTARLSDNYLAWTNDRKLDRRLLIAMGVVLDFRQAH